VIFVVVTVVVVVDFSWLAAELSMV